MPQLPSTELLPQQSVSHPTSTNDCDTIKCDSRIIILDAKSYAYSSMTVQCTVLCTVSSMRMGGSGSEHDHDSRYDRERLFRIARGPFTPAIRTVEQECGVMTAGNCVRYGIRTRLASKNCASTTTTAISLLLYRAQNYKTHSTTGDWLHNFHRVRSRVVCPQYPILQNSHPSHASVMLPPPSTATPSLGNNCQNHRSNSTHPSGRRSNTGNRDSLVHALSIGRMPRSYRPSSTAFPITTRSSSESLGRILDEALSIAYEAANAADIVGQDAAPARNARS
jgi:hypothetical protein